MPPWLGLAGRAAVGAVLAASGTMKAAGPAEEFAVVIAGYNLLPNSMVMSAAGVLPWLEVLVGYSMILGYHTRAAAAAAGAMLGAFVIALLSSVVRGYQLPNCGCFGKGIHLSPLQAAGMDLLLMACAFAAFRGGAAMASLDRWMYNGGGPQAQR